MNGSPGHLTACVCWVLLWPPGCGCVGLSLSLALAAWLQVCAGFSPGRLAAVRAAFSPGRGVCWVFPWPPGHGCVLGSPCDGVLRPSHTLGKTVPMRSPCMRGAGCTLCTQGRGICELLGVSLQESLSRLPRLLIYLVWILFMFWVMIPYSFILSRKLL